MNTTINIAILAHVDAGKTTLTEALLYHTGELRKLGNVDKGTAVSDFLPVEKDRGISVVASNVSFNYQGIDFNIIDTPGHADFVSEVERSLIAADIVILMISASDGVQAQTRSLWQIIEKLRIPKLILVNKIDNITVDIERVVLEIKTELKTPIVVRQNVNIAEDKHVLLSSILSAENELKDEYYETLADYDDEILNDFLQGNIITEQKAESVYKTECRNAIITPLLYSVAKKSIGIPDLLDEIVKVFLPDNINSDLGFSARVFKISHNALFGRMAFIKIISGSLHKKQEVYNQRIADTEKINLIKRIFSNRFFDIEEAIAGQIVAVTGFMNARVGDVLGEVNVEQRFEFNTVPILTVEVKSVEKEKYAPLAQALLQMNMEDPLLNFRWFKDEQQLHINVNGKIQIQILQRLIKDRYDIETVFETPSIIYKETPKTVAFAYEEYTMPKPCWAVIKLKVEPAPRGSGVEYHSEVGVNDILLKYQKEVERTIPLALEQGIKGWGVTDIKITLVDGEDHVMHSRSGDFVVATPMAIMNALKEADTELLEPIMKFNLQAPESILGQIVSDIHKMRGEFEQPVFFEDKISITGKLPASTSMDYPVALASLSGGKAFIQMQFDSYQLVDERFAVIREFRGISPLHRAKYILKARNAIH